MHVHKSHENTLFNFISLSCAGVAAMTFKRRTAIHSEGDNGEAAPPTEIHVFPQPASQPAVLGRSTEVSMCRLGSIILGQMSTGSAACSFTARGDSADYVSHLACLPVQHTNHSQYSDDDASCAPKRIFDNAFMPRDVAQGVVAIQPRVLIRPPSRPAIIVASRRRLWIEGAETLNARKWRSGRRTSTRAKN